MTLVLVVGCRNETSFGPIANFGRHGITSRSMAFALQLSET